MDNKLSDQELVRREKLGYLKDKGLDPFGSSFERTDTTSSLKLNFDKYSKDELAELDQKEIDDIFLKYAKQMPSPLYLSELETLDYLSDDQPFVEIVEEDLN